MKLRMLTINRQGLGKAHHCPVREHRSWRFQHSVWLAGHHHCINCDYCSLICWMDRPYILCCLYRSATGARAPSTTALGTGGLDSSMSNIFPKLQFITCEFKRKNLSQLVDVPWSFLSRHLGRPVRRVRPSFNINTIIKKNIVAMQAIEDVWLLSNPDHQEHKSAPMEVLLALTSTQSTF